MTGWLAAALLAAGTAVGQGLPADGDGAEARLEASPRHGEWISYEAGAGDRVKGWVSFPERADAAPVVVVIHDIAAMTSWALAVADQLAADGFVALVPDLLSGKGPEGGGTESIGSDGVRRAMGELDPAEVHRRLRAAAAYGTSLASTTDRVGVVGFCWGGRTAFALATDFDELDAAVVFYGSAPPLEALGRIRAPVLGHYGGEDNRVNATLPETEAEMKRLGRLYEVNVYEGAGHGFLKRQSGHDGANRRASEAAWPRTIDFLRAHLEAEAPEAGAEEGRE